MSRYRLYSASCEAPHGATPLVVVPGLAAPMAAWEPFITAARARGPVGVFDPNQWEGAGAEDTAAQTTLADLTAGLIGMMDTLGWAQAHLFGHSLGGMVALDLVLRHPARIGALILMSTTPEAMTGEQQAQALDLLKRLPRGGMGPSEISQWMPLETEAHTTERRAAERALPPARRATTQEVIASGSQSMPAGRQAAHALVTRLDQTPHLGGITAPTLVLVGELDGPLLQRGAELLHGWIPTSRLVRIEGAGHHPQVDRPEDVERLALSFIAETEATLE